MSHQGGGPRNYVHKDFHNQIVAELQARVAELESEQRRKPVDAPKLAHRSRRCREDHLRRLPDGRLLFFDHDWRANSTFVFEVLDEVRVLTLDEMDRVFREWSPAGR